MVWYIPTMMGEVKSIQGLPGVGSSSISEEMAQLPVHSLENAACLMSLGCISSTTPSDASFNASRRSHKLPECAFCHLVRPICVHSVHSAMTTPRRSTQEDSFELRIVEVFANLAMTNTSFLPLKVTACMITEEFPSRLLEEHGEFFAQNCTFERPEVDRKCPIKVTVNDYNNPEVGAGGWHAFLVDNSVEVGDILFFSVLEMTRYLVQIVRKPSGQLAILLTQPNAVAPCRECEIVMRPWFLAPVHNAFLEVPGWFWARHHKMLRSENYQLECPNTDIMVVEARLAFIREEAQVVQSIRLESGWDSFVLANHLQVGDYLLFVAVSPSRFKVECF